MQQLGELGSVWSEESPHLGMDLVIELQYVPDSSSASNESPHLGGYRGNNWQGNVIITLI